MKRIFKYKLPRDGGVVTINAAVCQWLEIHSQNGWPHIWAIVDDEGAEMQYEIVAWGTGWEMPDELELTKYLGTAQDMAGYVWHYFVMETAPSYITTTVEYDYNPYGCTLTTKGNPVQPYTINISCGEADSAVCTTNTKVTDSWTTATIENLRKALEDVEVDRYTALYGALT